MVSQKFVVHIACTGSPSGRSALGRLDARPRGVLHTKAPSAPRPPGLRALRDSRCTPPCMKDFWDSTLAECELLACPGVGTTGSARCACRDRSAPAAPRG